MTMTSLASSTNFYIKEGCVIDTKEGANLYEEDDEECSPSNRCSAMIYNLRNSPINKSNF